MAIVAYIDGGARGNPGPAGYGVRIEDERGTLIDEFNGFLGTSTNNVAEYNGLLAALKYAQQHGHRKVHIKSDSELLVKQMRGEYRVKNAGSAAALSAGARDRAGPRTHRVRARATRAEQGRGPARKPRDGRRNQIQGLGIGDEGLGSRATCGRDPLVDAIVRFLAHDHVTESREIRACLERAIDEAGPGAIDRLSARLAGTGADWIYYARDPLARRIHHALAPRVLRDPMVSGSDHLDEVIDKPVVIFANHLSYSDANVLDVVLQNAGAGALADRLTVVAGPKVYSSVTRRFSSLCFGTIKVPRTRSDRRTRRS